MPNGDVADGEGVFTPSKAFSRTSFIQNWQAGLVRLAEDGAVGQGPLAGDYRTQALIAIAQQLKRLADAHSK